MKVLFVCTGNTCRSPMAEAYLASKRINGLEVQSRGILADGSPVSENSVKAMAEVGIDISGLCSEQLNFGDIAWADRIICMSPSHKTALKMYAEESKITVLGDGISDPYGGDGEIYKKCRDEIFRETDRLIQQGFFSEVYIERLKKENIGCVAELEKICFSVPWSERVIGEAAENGTVFFTAVSDGRVIGYVGVSCVADEGYMANLAVLPEYRRQGVASRLLERVFSLAADEGLAFVSLEVRVSNKSAISLYEKHGFKQEGRRPSFYSAPKEDALILTKRF